MKLGRRWLIAVVTLSLLPFVSIKPTHAAPFQPGQIFVAYGGNQFAQISPPYELDSVGYLGPLTYSFATSATNLQGGGVALDEDGYLYVTFGTGSGNRGIVKIAPNGSVVKTVTVGTSPDFRGIAAKGGKVAVATDSGVHIYDSNLNLLQALSGNYRDVAFDDAGNLYALHQTRVDRYKLVSGTYQFDGTVVSGLGNAVAITFDGAGNLYVVDRSGQQVKKLFGQEMASAVLLISRAHQVSRAETCLESATNLASTLSLWSTPVPPKQNYSVSAQMTPRWQLCLVAQTS